MRCECCIYWDGCKCMLGIERDEDDECEYYIEKAAYFMAMGDLI